MIDVSFSNHIVDPVDNFMNYIGKRGEGEKGQCYKDFGRFTPGQIERMVMMYETFRKPDEAITINPTVSPTESSTTGPTGTIGTVLLPATFVPSMSSTGGVVLLESSPPTTAFPTSHPSNESIPPSFAPSRVVSSRPTERPSSSPTTDTTDSPTLAQQETLTPSQSPTTSVPLIAPSTASPSVVLDSQEEEDNPPSSSSAGIVPSDFFLSACLIVVVMAIRSGMW